MSEWRTIDSAPKDGREIFGFEDGCIFRIRWAHHYWLNGEPQTEKSWGRGSIDGPAPNPTHWQPLPEPPQ